MVYLSLVITLQILCKQTQEASYNFMYYSLRSSLQKVVDVAGSICLLFQYYKSKIKKLQIGIVKSKQTRYEIIFI